MPSLMLSQIGAISQQPRARHEYALRPSRAYVPPRAGARTATASAANEKEASAPDGESEAKEHITTSREMAASEELPAGDMSFLPYVQGFDFHELNVQCPSAQQIEALARHPEICSITWLKVCGMDERDKFAPLAYLISQMTSLTDLEVSDRGQGEYDYDSPEMATHCSVYRSRPGLASHRDAFAAMIPHIGLLTRLERLTVKNVPIHDTDAEALGAELAHLKCLQSLQLKGNGIGAEGTTSLWPHLATLPSLDTLYVIGSVIGDRGATALAPHLGKMTALYDLFLQDCAISDEGAEALAPQLAKISKLNTLALDSNTIGDSGAMALGPHLATLPELATLALDHNRIGDEGAKALWPLLSALPNGDILWLGHNEIGDEGAKALVPYMTKVRSKWGCSIILGDNRIGEEGVACLAPFHPPKRKDVRSTVGVGDQRPVRK